jgi:hypothetical protein
MATMTLSTALAADITDSITYRTAADSTYEYPSYQGSAQSIAQSRASIGNFEEYGSIFASYRSYYDGLWNMQLDNTTANACKFEFQNSSGTTLTFWYAHEIVSRTIDANGYCVLTNFPQKIPSVAGTIEKLVITAGASANSYADLRTITLIVGDQGSGSDVEFNDRVLVTDQPWRLDTSIKFRIPMTWNWST